MALGARIRKGKCSKGEAFTANENSKEIPKRFEKKIVGGDSVRFRWRSVRAILLRFEIVANAAAILRYGHLRTRSLLERRGKAVAARA